MGEENKKKLFGFPTNYKSRIVSNSQYPRPNHLPRTNSVVLQQNMRTPNVGIKLPNGRLALLHCIATNPQNTPRQSQPISAINSTSNTGNVQQLPSRICNRFKVKTTIKPQNIQRQSQPISVINSASNTGNVQQTPSGTCNRFQVNTTGRDHSTTNIKLEHYRTPQVQSNIMGEQIKRQCKLLLERWVKEFERTQYSQNIKTLVKSLIDSQISTEVFLQYLKPLIKRTLPSDILMFLNKSLPLVRKALIAKEFSLDYLTSPPLNYQEIATTNNDVSSKCLAVLLDAVKFSKNSITQYYVKKLIQQLIKGRISGSTFCKRYEEVNHIRISLDIRDMLDRNFQVLQNLVKRFPQASSYFGIITQPHSQVMPTARMLNIL